MIPLPTTFPSQNTHRVVLHQQALPGTDFERLEDLTADATAAARRALEEVDKLPYELVQAHQRSIKMIGDFVGKRRVLSQDFRNAAELVLRALARADVADEAAQAHDAVMRNLRDALNLSHRVADLLAAERDIFWHRDNTFKSR